MPIIDMSTLSPVGEFGSKAWGEACSEASVKILEAADIPADTNWAFTEDYTHPPARLMEGERTHAGYYIMVKDGKVSAGDGIPDAARALPGFHVRMPWAYLCNQSGALYGREGQQRRSGHEAELMAAIVAHTGNDNPFNFIINAEGKPNAFLDPVGPWPSAVGSALGEGGEDGNGLHNIAATLQSDSPEFADLPVTDMRVPIFGEMTDDQKQFFLDLCGIGR
ncbi:MAG: hypothetical protein CMQ05_11165 [Gammaproteobacteria bacterium]|uniref:Uncharacterized protein n=1 Tax=OM182 bacterium MED-G24 TaxID=1986255 RepID=A0A2A5WMG7_9GAMM|nr:hypothetical protein [Gammaproteobacteria bacterium]PDH37611.1 MAG: hypothetical protein CNE99_07910 [OM182 bacterium MED-G24]RPG24587.1 MAG: hypothetical protein CBC10_010660 [Gammaproteobacteria bacterium TMED50]|tara:strand:- start:5491 stop:6156 length:666 start_codon:yes stop_codon:yes gene_type:complete